MFCPACGKDNSEVVKFCASCGTNLEVVSRALYSSSTGLFTRAENALNHVVTRYSERVFRNAPANALSRKLSDSWIFLGQGIITAAVDFLLFWLMLFVVFPVKMLSLLLSSPVRLLLERGSRQKPVPALASGKKAPTSAELVAPDEWGQRDMVSAVEHTTEHLSEFSARRQRQRTEVD